MEFRSSAVRRSTEARRRNAHVLLALGAGAGLRAEEIALAKVGDVFIEAGDLAVGVRGRHPRRVPVRTEWCEALSTGLGERDGEEWAFTGYRIPQYPARVIHQFRLDDRTESTPQATRLRARWIVQLLQAGVPINLVLSLTGLAAIVSRVPYVKALPAADCTTFRAAITGAGCAPMNTEMLGIELTEDETRGAGARASSIGLHAVKLADARLAATGVLEKLAEWRKADRDPRVAGGVDAVITDRHMLVALFVLAREHAPLWITSVSDIFWFRLTDAARQYLGLPETVGASSSDEVQKKRWLNNSWAALHRMVDLMDPYPVPNRRKSMGRDEREAIVTGQDAHIVTPRDAQQSGSTSTQACGWR